MKFSEQASISEPPLGPPLLGLLDLLRPKDMMFHQVEGGR
jgi:hypothetical protein